MSLSGRWSLRVPAELALLGVSAATLAGFHRLFTDWSFLGSPLLLLVVSHLLAVALRRRGVPLIPSAILSVIACVIVGSQLFYRDTTHFLLPSGRTLDQFTADVREAIQLFRDVEAPTEPMRGFLVASGISFWVTAFLADWSAFRLWAPFEATLPAGGLFVFASLFGADQYRVPSTVLFLVSVLAFLLLHRASRLEASASWIRGDASRGSRSLVRAGVAVGVVAVLVGIAVGPLVPGARASAMVDWKGLGSSSGTRVTLSPLVDIQSRLVNQKNTEVFTVRSDVRANWRLTALDSFDGRLWKASQRFSKVDSQLPGAGSTEAHTALVKQDFTVDQLSQIWLPAAFEPRKVDILSKGPVTRWEPITATLIVDKPSSDGLKYSVTSRLPTYEATDLRNSVAPPPQTISSQFLSLPGDFPARVRKLATDLTSGAATPYDKALALQNFFRQDGNFRYTLEVQKGHSDNRLEQFLFESRAGYCEQFAGSYAAMARAIGLPARVAVGFTPGDIDASDPTLFHVLGKHAHAWPEVYLTGYGWVPFEPTPGRGAPNAAYTGVSEQQDSPPLATIPNASTSTTITDPEPIPGATGAGGALPAEPVDGGSTSTTAPGPQRSSGNGWAGWLLYTLAAIILVYVGAVMLGRRAWRALRRRRAASARAQIDLAWREAVESLGILGVSARSAETPLEFADRARQRTRLEAPFHELASLATEARYSGDSITDDDVAAARQGSVAVLERVKEQTSLPQRLGYELSPKLLVRRRPRGQRRRSTGQTLAD